MTRRLAVGLVALALALPLPAAAQTGDLRGQIEKLSKTWEKDYNAGDAAGLAALYTKDAQLMAPGAEAASGTKAIRAALAADIASGAKFSLSTADVVGAGDHAVETGKWVATSADGKHLDHGPYMTLYTKEGGGWKISKDIWNSAMASKK
jgi:uncharacterized protein (TIGR02246 family)